MVNCWLTKHPNRMHSYKSFYSIELAATASLKVYHVRGVLGRGFNNLAIWGISGNCVCKS